MIDYRYGALVIGVPNTRHSALNIIHGLGSKFIASAINYARPHVPTQTSSPYWQSVESYDVNLWQLQLAAQKVDYDEYQLGLLYDAVLSQFIEKNPRFQINEDYIVTFAYVETT